VEPEQPSRSRVVRRKSEKVGEGRRKSEKVGESRSLTARTGKCLNTHLGAHGPLLLPRIALRSMAPLRPRQRLGRLGARRRRHEALRQLRKGRGDRRRRLGRRRHARAPQRRRRQRRRGVHGCHVPRFSAACRCCDPSKCLGQQPRQFRGHSRARRVAEFCVPTASVSCPAGLPV